MNNNIIKVDIKEFVRTNLKKTWSSEKYIRLYINDGYIKTVYSINKKVVKGKEIEYYLISETNIKFTDRNKVNTTQTLHLHNDDSDTFLMFLDLNIKKKNSELRMELYHNNNSGVINDSKHTDDNGIKEQLHNDSLFFKLLDKNGNVIYNTQLDKVYYCDVQKWTYPKHEYDSIPQEIKDILGGE